MSTGDLDIVTRTQWCRSRVRRRFNGSGPEVWLPPSLSPGGPHGLRQDGSGAAAGQAGGRTLCQGGLGCARGWGASRVLYVVVRRYVSVSCPSTPIAIPPPQVEATKYTELGYVGRDVEEIIKVRAGAREER